jgi:hypothetical protein
VKSREGERKVVVALRLYFAGVFARVREGSNTTPGVYPRLKPEEPQYLRAAAIRSASACAVRETIDPGATTIGARRTSLGR